MAQSNLVPPPFANYAATPENSSKTIDGSITTTWTRIEVKGATLRRTEHIRATDSTIHYTQELGQPSLHINNMPDGQTIELRNGANGPDQITYSYSNIDGSILYTRTMGSFGSGTTETISREDFINSIKAMPDCDIFQSWMETLPRTMPAPHTNYNAPPRTTSLRVVPPSSSPTAYSPTITIITDGTTAIIRNSDPQKLSAMYERQRKAGETGIPDRAFFPMLFMPSIVHSPAPM